MRRRWSIEQSSPDQYKKEFAKFQRVDNDIIKQLIDLRKDIQPSDISAQLVTLKDELTTLIDTRLDAEQLLTIKTDIANLQQTRRDIVNEINKLIVTKLSTYAPSKGFTITQDDGTIATFGNWVSIYRTMDMRDHQIKNADNPTDDQDAATKRYVDQSVRSIIKEGDIYLVLELAITERTDFQTFIITPARKPNISIADNRGILLQPGTYRVHVI